MYETLSSGNVIKAPLELIFTHPNNPASLSAKYSKILGYPVRVEDDQVELLIGNLRSNGYDPNEPLLLRPVDGKLQAIKGNHRFVAMWMLVKVFKELDQDYIPAIVEDMDEQRALVKLYTLNGRKVDGWMAARLAYYACSEGGMTVSDYARAIGLLLSDNMPNASRVSRWVQSCQFVDFISKNSSLPEMKNPDALTDKEGLFRSLDRVGEFMYLDQEDWVWVSEFYLRHHLQISADRRKALASTLKKVKTLLNRADSYPERWSEWLRWEYIREEVASQCAASGESIFAESILPQLISEANKAYESDELPFIYNYHEVISGQAIEKTANLKEDFRRELINQIETRKGKYYRQVDVLEASRGVIDRYRFIEEKYQNFKKIASVQHIEQKIVAIAPPEAKPKIQQSSSPVELKAVKLDTEKRLWVEEQYQPKGIVESLRDRVEHHSDRQYKFVFSRIDAGGIDDFFQNTDYIYGCLAEDGLFALIVPSRYSPAVIDELEYRVANASRLHLRGLDGGVYSDEKPRIAITSSARSLIHESYEELLLFTTQDDTPLVMHSTLPKIGLEPVHDILRTFADPNDTLLDPFAFNGEVVIASKSLGYRCDYLVSSQEQLDLIQRWCDRTEFPSSLFN